ncbi:MAG: heat-inducible transcription repressor HrcA [Candidatus Omnitrophica bacterium]|nr:heat-inducible transcription repressor HrcA [Candidatus Omnitrophota bacterium]
MVYQKNRDERNSEILSQIIQLYTATAIPVSSKSVAESMDNIVSSATIRNIMAELEEDGFIEQPHTSAGRRPTDRGYRHYVDHLNGRLSLEKHKVKKFEEEFFEKVRSIKDLIEQSSHLINRQLHYASAVMLPDTVSQYMKHLELLKIKSDTVMAVLVTMTNIVENYIIKLDGDIEKGQLNKIANFINEKCEGKKVSDILEYLKGVNSVADKNSELGAMSAFAIRLIDGMAKTDIENEIFITGMDCFSGQADFSNSEDFRNLLKILSDKKLMMKIMKGELSAGGMRFYIGHENEPEPLKKCSLVTFGYEFHGTPLGRIGIIGPTRMHYENVFQTVNYLIEVLNSKIEGLS